MHKRREKRRNERNAQLDKAIEALNPEFESVVKQLQLVEAEGASIVWQDLPPGLDPMSQLTKLTKQGRAKRKRQQLQSMIHAVSRVIQPGDTVCDFGSGQGHLGLLIAYSVSVNKSNFN